MPGRVEGKVAFITGAARGQGRSHAIRLAQEGADIIAVDLAGQVDSVPYPMATPDDLDRDGQGGRGAGPADRRHPGRRPRLRRAEEGAATTGVAAAGPAGHRLGQRRDRVVRHAADELAEQTWRDMIDINLTGMWHTCKAAIPHLRRRPRRVDRDHQLRRGTEGAPEHGALRVGQARGRRPDADARAGAGPGHDPGQLAAPDHGQHRHGPERRDVRAVRARPGREGPDEGAR